MTPCISPSATWSCCRWRWRSCSPSRCCRRGTIRRIALIGFAIALAWLALTFVIGAEIKGARRWINLPGLSLQPSEFVKPTFAVVAAWLFAEQKLQPRFPGNLISIALFLVDRRDADKAARPRHGGGRRASSGSRSSSWPGCGSTGSRPAPSPGSAGCVGAYLWLPHVTSRINRFLDPAAGDSYQVNRSIEAFANGGLWGRGPGEGTVKDVLPDAHADFVFAVAGEEFGLVVCLVDRRAVRVHRAARLFAPVCRKATCSCCSRRPGCWSSSGCRRSINMASSLHLIPTKGMTLPFLSYGGSSMLALALGMGMMLALTRRRLGGSEL